MTLLFGGFFLLLLLGVPIAFSMIGVGLVYLSFEPRISMMVAPQQLVDSLDSFPLLAVPFFVLAGFLMNAAGVTGRLVAMARSLIGHIRGGLAHAMIMAGMLMAGVSGSGTADAAALGSVMIPAMKEDRYDAGFAVALSAAAGAIGPIIPPSIMLIIYGHLGNVSVGQLFLAGAIPGVLFGLFLMAVAYFTARAKGYGSDTARAPLRVMVRALRLGLLDLTLPVLVIGGIVAGAFTPTEAGAVAVVYVLLIGLLVYRTLNRRTIVFALRESIMVLGTVMLTIAAAGILQFALALMQAGALVTEFFAVLGGGALLFLLLTNVLLILLGCVLEVTAVLVLLTPILVPALAQFGIDPVQFGVIMTLNLAIGLLTPPVGLGMFVTCAIGNVSVERYVRAAWPMLLALLGLLVLVNLVPGLTLWLPGLAFE
ncbi:MAG: TRAP transporter large permease [Tistlia sp.]|uniref:TRAP transporter large permease n=1 Tax=Tistlia sp. TaxID=3057121 RepID=UPI0034A35391